MDKRLPTLKVITLGCSKNTVDTEHLLGMVGSSFEVLPLGDDTIPEEGVDYLLVNTCGFIGDAKEESVNVVLRCAQLKGEGRVGHLFVFGCLSQRYASELPGLIPEVDAWFGARELEPIARELGVEPSRYAQRYFPSSSSYAYMKISEGCDRRCSYCAIPFIRGAHRSVPMEELEQEARSLAAKGVRELLLIAQDTTYYGLDLYHERALGKLLRRLSLIEGIEWIRIHYSYPQDFPEDVLEEMAANPKVCRYMDIPLQHVSDKVLDNMHRHVDGAWTRALIGRMREKVPGIALRTTMIVGHPGEGTREFEELLSFVQDARFERLGAFTYSEEEGTFGAENFKDSVRPSTKARRLQRLMEIQSGISFAYNLSRVGTRPVVLVDGCRDGVLVCRSEFESPEVDGEILVEYDPGMGHPAEEMTGQFIQVEVTSADRYDLCARWIGNVPSPREPLE